MSKSNSKDKTKKKTQPTKQVKEVKEVKESKPAPRPAEAFKPSSSLESILNRLKGLPEQTPIFRSISAQKDDKTTIKLNPTHQKKLQTPFEVPQGPLQSIQGSNKPKHSIIGMTHKQRSMRAQQDTNDNKRTKKYANIELPSLMGASQRKSSQVEQPDIEVDQKLAKPSIIYQLPQPHSNIHCIFQTPPLPCFQQPKIEISEKPDPVSNFFQTQYDSCGNEITENYRGLAKEGVYHIGKIKIKGKKAELVIGGVKMEACLGFGQGKAVSISESNMYELGKWEGMWIVQPTEETFQ